MYVAYLRSEDTSSRQTGGTLGIWVRLEIVAEARCGVRGDHSADRERSRGDWDWAQCRRSGARRERASWGPRAGTAQASGEIV